MTSFQQEKDKLLQNKDTEVCTVTFQIAWVLNSRDGFKTWLPLERAD